MKLFNKSFVKKATSLCIAVIMVFGLNVMAADKDSIIGTETITQGYSSGVAGLATLGESNLITTPEELKAVAELVNSGADVSGMKFVLSENIFMTQIEDWTPIGTKEHPFNGYFDGQNHYARRLATDTHPALFGYIDGGTLINTNITVSFDTDVSKPNVGLFVEAKNATIENCRVYPEWQFARMMRSAIAPTFDWVDTGVTNGGGGKDYTLTKASDILGLAALTEDFTDGGKGVSIGFLGDTIIFDKIIDMDAASDGFEGIGTKDNPFKGTVKGGGVKNMHLVQTASSSLGLFAYAVEAKFEDVSIIDSSVFGADNVGLMVGFMQDSSAENCMSSGEARGNSGVGGLIGVMGTDHAKAKFVNIDWCYSTANAVGTASVGGLIGEVSVYSPSSSPHSPTLLPNRRSNITHCFTTGNVNGLIQVGGIVGNAIELVDLLSDLHGIYFSEVATSGNIVGAGKVGGIMGGGPSQDSELFQLEHAYVSGNVYGNSDTGGIAGIGLQGAYAYISGHVVGPRVMSDSTVSGGPNDFWDALYIQYGTSLSGSMTKTDAVPLYAEYNTIYPTENYMNEDQSIFQNGHRRGDYTSLLPVAHPSLGTPIKGPQSLYEKEIKYFNEEGGTDIGAPTVFKTSTLVYQGVDHESRATSGYFPRFASFDAPASGNASIDAAFKEFSELSTNAEYKNVPTKLYSKNNDKALAETTGATATGYKLPNIPNATWKFNGSPATTAQPLEIVDETLEAKVNKIIFNPTTRMLEVDAPILTEYEIVAVATITGMDSFQMSYTMRVIDETNRPTFDFGGTREYMYASEPEATAAGAKAMSPQTIYSYMSFEEPVRLPLANIKLELTEYSNRNFGGTATPFNNDVEVKVINDKILRIAWPKGLIKLGKSYKLNFVSTKTVVDNAGNEFLTTFFMTTLENLPPVLSFDMDYELAKAANGGEVVGSKQTLYLEENDLRFFSINDGFIIEDQQFITSDQIKIVSHKINVSAQGKENYPTVNTTPGSINFYKVPGEYEYKYYVADPTEPANPAMNSNELTRVYRVNGDIKVKQGGGNLKAIHIAFSDDDIQRMLKESDNTGKSIEGLIAEELEKRYLKTVGPDQLTAYFYDYKGNKVDRKITFDTSELTRARLKSGYEGILKFTVEGSDEVFYYSVSIASTSPDKVIVTDTNNFIVKNKFSKAEAMKAINARVVRRSNPSVTLPDRVYYDLSGIDRYKMGVPQTVKLTVHDPKRDHNIDPETIISAEVTITIVKEFGYTHPDYQWARANEDRENFWEGKTDFVKKTAANTNMPVNLSFYNGAIIPTDFFLEVAKAKNLHVDLNLENGYKIALKSEKTNISKLDKSVLFHNLNVEDMYSLNIERDARGAVTQQFFTQDSFVLPGSVTLTIPLRENLPTKELKLYYIDAVTNRYVLEQAVSSDMLVGDSIVLEMESFEGEYVITAFDLDGVISTFERDYLK